MQGNCSTADLQEDSVASEELQGLHCFQMQCNDRVVVVESIVHNQTIGRLLPFQNSCAKVLLLLSFTANTSHTTMSAVAKQT